MLRELVVVCGAALAHAQGQGQADRVPSIENPQEHVKWQNLYASNQTAWHLQSPNPVLQKYLRELVGEIPSMEAPEVKHVSILLPLCGQSQDLDYLANRGFTVYGVEAIGQAVDAVLKRFGTEMAPEGQVLGRTSWDKRGTPLVMRHAVSETRKLYIVEDDRGHEEIEAELRILHGDFLLITTGAANKLGMPRFDAAFDRGALVAVQPSDRPQYAKVLTNLVKTEGRILLAVAEHDGLFGGALGPPYSVTYDQMEELFGEDFTVRVMEREDSLSENPTWRDQGVKKFSKSVYLLTKLGPWGLWLKKWKQKLNRWWRMIPVIGKGDLFDCFGAASLHLFGRFDHQLALWQLKHLKVDYTGEGAGANTVGQFSPPPAGGGGRTAKCDAVFGTAKQGEADPYAFPEFPPFPEDFALPSGFALPALLPLLLPDAGEWQEVLFRQQWEAEQRLATLDSAGREEALVALDREARAWQRRLPVGSTTPSAAAVIATPATPAAVAAVDNLPRVAAGAAIGAAIGALTFGAIGLGAMRLRRAPQARGAHRMGVTWAG